MYRIGLENFVANLEVIKNDRGITIPFVAIFLVVIMAFFALVVDLSLLADGSQQAQHHGQLIALDALETYFDTNVEDQVADIIDEDDRDAQRQRLKRAAALTEAYAMAGFNKRIAEHDDVGGVSYKDSEDGDDSVITDQAEILFGRWHYKSVDQDDLATSKCDEGYNDYPCFETVPSEDERINSVKIAGGLYNPYRPRFAQHFIRKAREKFVQQIDATASIIPRRGCFLVDLSPSIVRDTHLNRQNVDQQSSAEQGFGRQFSFRLASDNGGGATLVNHDAAWGILGGSGSTTDGVSVNFSDRPGAWSGSPASLVSGIFSDQPLIYRTLHYQDDYKLRRIYDDSHYDPDIFPNHPSDFDYPVGSLSKAYRVDTYRDESYGGPEPLRTVFAGLRRAVSIFQERQVAGDKVCLIFYDNTLTWPRIVNLTDDFDYLLKLTDFGTYDEALAVLNDSATISYNADLEGFDLINRHGLFPGFNTFTDMSAAYREAMLQFTRAREDDPDVPASEFIVFIGDGLVNCYTSGGAQRCANNLDYYNNGMAELVSSVDTVDPNKEIPLHFILRGDSVAPHTVKRLNSDTGKCMTDTEARVSGIEEYVLDMGTPTADQFASAGSATPFYHVNSDLYKLAVYTRGVWGPVRPRNAAWDTVDGYVSPCTNEGNPTGTPGSVSYLNNNAELFDPQCRATQQQISDYMEQIIGQNPFVLVDVR